MRSLLGLLLLTACAPTQASGAARVEGEGFPRELVLADGRRFPIVAPPERIVPAFAGAFDLVASLVGPERVAALPFNALDYSLHDADTWRTRPSFPRYSAEDVIAHAPDLVLAAPWQSPEATAWLRARGLPVVLLDDVRGLDSLIERLRLLGRLLGEEVRAAELERDWRARADALAAGAAPRAGVRALTYSNYGAGGWTAAEGTTSDVALALAGVTNAATEAGLVGHAPLTFERLLALDPELILVSAPLPGSDAGATESLLRTDERLIGLRAVREDGIIVLPARLYTADSQAVLEAAEFVARVVDAR